MKTVCIIVNYNNESETIRQLKSIKDFTCIDHIIVVDNASAPSSRIRLLSYIKHDESGKLELIVRGANGGYGAGNNAGLTRAAEMGATYALIANPDVEYTQEAVEQLVGVMEKHHELAVIAPVMVMSEAVGLQKKPGSYPNIILAPAAWPLRGPVRELLEMGPVSRRLFAKLLHYPEEHYLRRSGRGIPAKTLKDSACVYVDAVPGSLLLADVSKVRRVGGYDEKMFMYGEETLLAYRLKRAGYKTALCLTQTYIHRHKQGVPSMKSQLERERSMRYYMRNYLGAGDTFMKIADMFFAVIHAEMKLREKLVAKAAQGKLKTGLTVRNKH